MPRSEVAETVRLGPNHRLAHVPDQQCIKYQSHSRKPGSGRWHTQHNLSYSEAQGVGEFIEQLREAHDIEEWLDGDGDG